MTKLRRSFLISLAVGVVLAFAAWQFIDTSPARTQLPLDRYEARLGEGKVATATLLDKDHEVHGTLTDGTNYTVKFPDGYTEQLTKNIVASKAKFDVDSQKDSPWLTLLLGWLPFILLLLAYPLIYANEKVFGFLSDISLLELADLNNKLLRELFLHAPGTFQHSLQVANLSEAVIDRIGGNALLTRVGALYHDIGKLYNPEFFIENQKQNFNPHKGLSDLQNAEMIIRSAKEK